MDSLKLSCEVDGKKYELGKPIDISLPIVPESESRAFDARPPLVGLYTNSNNQQFNLSVSHDGSCNCSELTINTHCDGTHTETFGHISKRPDLNSINELVGLTQMYLAQLLTIMPTHESGDHIITIDHIQGKLFKAMDALVIRTLPNNDGKKTKNWAGTNPPYFDPAALAYIAKRHVKHLLVDLPSVDREDSNGMTPAHSAWRNYDNNRDINDKTRTDSTITELVYIPAIIKDGKYLLNLGVAPIAKMDAAPSRPLLYPLIDM